MDARTKRALSFWQVAFQYLDLSENVAKLISESGNRWVFIQEGWDTNRLEEEHREATRWSDYHQGIPVIFNFYHGLEVLLKGFLVAEGKNLLGHGLTHLYGQVSDAHPNAEFLHLVKRYLFKKELPEILGKFLEESGVSIDRWYQALRYPEGGGVRAEIYAHEHLQFQTDIGAEFFGDLSRNIHEIRVSAVRYARAKYDGLL